MIKTVAKVIKIVNSETDPAQISLALSLSMVAGLTPLMSLHNLLVLLLVLVLKVNISTFILGTVAFSGIAFLLDPLFHRIGLEVLTIPALENFWTILYNTTLFRLERFNNTILMGSLLVAVILFVPVTLAADILIIRYRERVLAWVEKTRIMKIYKASKYYSLINSFSGKGGRS
ncbi:MAG: TIGR03546 family protein [bacterium]